MGRVSVRKSILDCISKNTPSNCLAHSRDMEGWMKPKGIFKAAAAATLLGLSLSLPASAALQNGWDRVYYSDEAHTEMVGERTLYCTGQQYQWWGTTSPYFDQELFPCQPSGPPTPIPGPF
jgi:hypothetical protein